MWRRSSISSTRRTFRAVRYTRLSLGKVATSSWAGESVRAADIIPPGRILSYSDCAKSRLAESRKIYSATPVLMKPFASSASCELPRKSDANEILFTSGFANLMRHPPLQPRAAIHFETAMRQGLLHSQIGHWPRRSAPVSVVTGPDLTQQSS